METKTLSETLFELFCADSNISCKRIATETDIKTSDYELSFDEQLLIAEIKECTPNEDEKKLFKVGRQKGSASGWVSKDDVSGLKLTLQKNN